MGVRVLFMRLLKLLEWKWKLGGLGGIAGLHITVKENQRRFQAKPKVKKKENHLEYLWIFIDQNE